MMAEVFLRGSNLMGFHHISVKPEMKACLGGSRPGQ